MPEASVEVALAHLSRLEELPVAAHVEVFDAVHRALQDSLASLDEA